MCEIQVKKTKSDNSTDSWTILDEDSHQEPQRVAPGGTTPTISLSDTEDNNDDHLEDIENLQGPDDGFLTFDEYLQERLIEHDYDYDPKSDELIKKHKSREQRRKCKARNISIAIFIIFMITISGIVTIFSALSAQNRVRDIIKVPRPKNLYTIQNEELYRDLVRKEVNRTVAELEKLKIDNKTPPSKLLDQKTPTIDSCPSSSNFIGPNVNTTAEAPKIEPKTVSFQTKTSLRPWIKNQLTKTNINTKVLNKWDILKDILLNTNVHALVSLIMTNVYLFALLSDLCKKHDHFLCDIDEKLLEEVTDTQKVEAMTKYLFEQLPYPEGTKATVSKKKHGNKAKKNDLMAINKRGPQLYPAHVNEINQIFNSYPSLIHKTDSKFLAPISVPPNSEGEESGKSECERRFDELDKYERKFDSLKQIQRDRIKLLKQKFKNEVIQIRDTEEESDTRAEKINRTSQRFISKLKTNREKYLLELRKVRESRRKIADDKKRSSEIVIGSKDVAVGVYSVGLPSMYDFRVKVKQQHEESDRRGINNKWKLN